MADVNALKRQYENKFFEMAYVHDPEKGLTSGLTDKEYQDLVNFLNGHKKELGNYYIDKLITLARLKGSSFNKEALDKDKPTMIGALLGDKAAKINRGLVVDYKTIQMYDSGRLDDADNVINYKNND